MNPEGLDYRYQEGLNCRCEEGLNKSLLCSLSPQDLSSLPNVDAPKAQVMKHLAKRQLALVQEQHRLNMERSQFEQEDQLRQLEQELDLI